MRATLLLLLISTAVAAAALELHVPLDRVSVRSPTRWIALNGTSQQLPFEACFGADFGTNWSAVKPAVVEISLPCVAPFSNSYMTSFAYARSYFRAEDHIHPTILRTDAGPVQHTADAKVPRVMLTEHDMFCLELEGPREMTCDLSVMYFRVY